MLTVGQGGAAIQWFGVLLCCVVFRNTAVLRAVLPYTSVPEYVKRVITALAREDGVLLEGCLSMSPQAIPGGQRLLESRLSDVRDLIHITAVLPITIVCCRRIFITFYF